MPGSAWPPHKAGINQKENAKEAKEMVSKKMTRAEITQTQELSREYWEAYGPAPIKQNSRFDCKDRRVFSGRGRGTTMKVKVPS